MIFKAFACIVGYIIMINRKNTYFKSEIIKNLENFKFLRKSRKLHPWSTLSSPSWHIELCRPDCRPLRTNRYTYATCPPLGSEDVLCLSPSGEKGLCSHWSENLSMLEEAPFPRCWWRIHAGIQQKCKCSKREH